MASTGRLRQLGPRISAPPQRINRAPDQGKPTAWNARPWKKWYDLAEWRRLRHLTFARDRYTCQMCGALQGDTSKLTCDHIRPHRGNRAMFFDPENLQTLCTEPCHVQHKQAQEQATRHQAGVWD